MVIKQTAVTKLSYVIAFNCLSPFLISIQAQNTQPNIILFVSDDHGKDALGCYGNKVIKTPHLDQLAAEGVRFNNAYCTSASSTASRSALLTGKYGHATASYGHSHDYHHFSTYDNVKSLPVLLQQNGYATARVGKYHLAPEKVYHFETVLSANARSTYNMALACEKVLNSEKPFFLYFCTDDPHRSDPFGWDDWSHPNNFGNRAEGYPGIQTITYKPDDVLVPTFLPDTKECREELAQYYQSVSRMDQGFGKLMNMLKATGKDKNTIVIYISDNGIAFPGAKTTVYEPGINLPCIIKNPLVSNKGTQNNAMISWVDMAPTILDMAQINYNPTHFHGKSFKNIISEENPNGWNEMYASHTFHEVTMYYPMRVYRNGNFKLIWNIDWRQEYPFASDLWASSTWQGIYRNKINKYGERKVKDFMFRPEFELYDLNADPAECNNLSEKKKYKDLLNVMKSKLRKFQKETNDPWVIMWNHDSGMQDNKSTH